jgi:hypothetical protein
MHKEVTFALEHSGTRWFCECPLECGLTFYEEDQTVILTKITEHMNSEHIPGEA